MSSCYDINFTKIYISRFLKKISPTIMLTTKNETGTKIILKKSSFGMPDDRLPLKTWRLLVKVYSDNLKSVSTTFLRNISNKLVKAATKPKANTPKIDIPDFLSKDAISKLIDK